MTANHNGELAICQDEVRFYSPRGRRYSIGQIVDPRGDGKGTYDMIVIVDFDDIEGNIAIVDFIFGASDFDVNSTEWAADIGKYVERYETITMPEKYGIANCDEIANND